MLHNLAGKICAIYGNNALKIDTGQFLFQLFNFGKINVKNEPRSGLPMTEKVDEILKCIFIIL